jgi:hypothetical protein
MMTTNAAALILVLAAAEAATAQSATFFDVFAQGFSQGSGAGGGLDFNTTPTYTLNPNGLQANVETGGGYIDDEFYLAAAVNGSIAGGVLTLSRSFYGEVGSQYPAGAIESFTTFEFYFSLDQDAVYSEVLRGQITATLSAITGEIDGSMLRAGSYRLDGSLTSAMIGPGELLEGSGVYELHIPAPGPALLPAALTVRPLRRRRDRDDHANSTAA